MKDQLKSYTILISHASDVKKELESIEKSVKRFNDLFSEFLKLTLKTCKWEDNLCPINAYTRPQEGVNEQLVASSDMCIAIFRTRFGSPRGGVNQAGEAYGSGTEEEIALISEQGKPVLVYFLDEECINMKSIDMDQYKKVKSFKEDYGTRYMYSLYNDKEDTYKTESDLEFQVFNHLCNYFIKDKEFIKTNTNDSLYFNLIGGFSKDSANDKRALKSFLQCSDNQLLAFIERIEIDINSKTNKSAYQKNNNDISITNRINFWKQNGTLYSDKSIFIKFQNFAQQVLHDPSNYSFCLVQGMCQTLALMQNHSDVFCNIKLINSIISIADNVAYSLFFDYSDNNKCLVALSQWIQYSQESKVLSILAEASPEIFLKAVDTATQHSNFKYSIKLLWALERLAWDSRYLVHVCATLTELSNHDSTGFIGNLESPIHSIETILKDVAVYDDEMQKIWDEKKIAAINLIKTHNPDFTIVILKNLIFENSFASRITTKNGKKVPSTFPEFFKLNIQYEYPNYMSNRVNNAYLKLVINFAKENLDCLKMLINNLDYCPEPLIYEILEVFESDIFIRLEDYKRYEIWDLLKSFIVNNRHFRNAEWAKSKECVNKAESVLVNIVPQKKLYTTAWYFINDDIIEEPWNGSEYDYEAENIARLKLRVEQLDLLIENDGLLSIVDLYEFCIKNKKFDAYSFACTLATLKNFELDKILTEKYLLSNKNARVITNYIGKRFVDEKSVLLFLDSCKNWSQKQICVFLSALSFRITAETLTVLITEEKYLKLYWSTVNVITSDKNALQEYFSNQRYELLLKCFHSFERDIDVTIIINTLTKILLLDELPTSSWLVLHQLEHLLKNENVPTEVKENLEWLYLKFYEPYGQSFLPIHLFDKLNNQIEYLCQIITEASDLSSHFKKGQANYLLWLWCPDFDTIPDFRLWYSSINEKLSKDASTYFQKHLGRKLHKRKQDSIIALPNTQILSVLDSSAIMSSSFSDAVCGMGDLDDLRFSVHGEDFHEQLKKEAPFWRKKAEEVDNLGYYKLATVFRTLADRVNQNFLFDD